MRQTRGTLRRATGALVVAFATVVVSAGGAGAVAVPALAGDAAATALEISVTIPGTADIKAALAKAGIPVAGIDTSLVDGVLTGVKLTQKISFSSATVSGGVATAKASPLFGTIVPASLTPGEATATCGASTCDAHDEVAALKLNLLDDVLPGVANIGTVRVAGGSADAVSNKNAAAEASLASVNVTLADLLSMEELKPVADALESLRSTFNDVVRPQVNDAVGDVKALLDNTLPSNVNEVIKGIITIGEIQPMPDLRTADLLDVKILPTTASVKPSDNRIFSSATSGVANVSVVGNWLKIGSIEALSKAFVDQDPQATLNQLKADNTVAAQTAKLVSGIAKRVGATKNLSLTNVDLFGPLGLLQIIDPELQVIDDKAYNALMNAIQEDADDLGLGEAATNLLNAVDIAYRTAGIKLETVSGYTKYTDPKQIVLESQSSATQGSAKLGMRAESVSDYLMLSVEPKIPLLADKLDVIASGTIPALDPKTDYVSSGLRLEVKFPQANTMAQQGAAVLGFRLQRTGIGISWLAVMVLFGAAIGVKRFALSK